MPFRLTNILTTFQAYINKALSGLLNIIYIVYFNNIIVYFNNYKVYIYHIQIVLEKLQEYKLYINLKKYLFYITSINFLGFIISINREKPGRHYQGITIPHNVQRSISFLKYSKLLLKVYCLLLVSNTFNYQSTKRIQKQ